MSFCWYKSKPKDDLLQSWFHSWQHTRSLLKERMKAYIQLHGKEGLGPSQRTVRKHTLAISSSVQHLILKIFVFRHPHQNEEKLLTVLWNQRMAKLKLFKANSERRSSQGFSKHFQGGGYHLILITKPATWQRRTANQHTVNLPLLQAIHLLFQKWPIFTMEKQTRQRLTITSFCTGSLSQLKQFQRSCLQTFT